MIQPGNAVANKTDRLRHRAKTNNTPETYDEYPTLVTVNPANTIRYSKGAYSSLPTGVEDLTYYLDYEGYEGTNSVASNDGYRDPITAVYVPLMDETVDKTFTGEEQNAYFGFPAIGDVNGDNYDDIICGAYNYDGFSGGRGIGRAYLFYGGTNKNYGV